MRLLRVFRGVMGTALIWGVAWSASMSLVTLAGAVMSSLSSQLPPMPAAVRFSPVIPSAILFGVLGLWAGAVFAITMAAIERQTGFVQLRVSRVLAWGALGGASLPSLLWALDTAAGVRATGMGSAVLFSAGLGAISAGGMLRLARQAFDREVAELAAGQADHHATRQPVGSSVTT